MVDQSRSNLLRERLCASGDSNLVFLGEALTDEWLDMLLQNAAKDQGRQSPLMSAPW